MIKLSLFRNKYFVIALSTLFLVFSCTSQGVESANTESRTIDYKIFENYKSNFKLFEKININQYDKSSQPIIEISQSILDEINTELGTNIVYSDEALQLPDHYGEEIIEISLANGWMEEVDVNLINDFMSDLENHDFNYAIANFENSILTLSVSDDKFEKLNTTANLIQSINYHNPELFNQVQKSELVGFWDCTLATIALTAATAGLASCATVAACALAFTLHVNAVRNFGRACFGRPEISNTQNN